VRDRRETEATEAKRRRKTEKQSIHTGYEKGIRTVFGGHGRKSSWAVGRRGPDSH
jgi:hypothetical protein